MWERLRGLRWPRESTLYYVACVVLVVAAAVPRFYALPSDGLRADEAIASLNAQGSFGELIENTRTQNSSPILWPIGLWLIQKIEVSRLSIRLAPAVASTLTVAALVVLLPLAGVRRSVAFPAGVLMAVSVAAIHEARDVREYSIDALLVVIMLAGALWYLKGEKRWLLPVTLFVGPLLQYGLVLLGVAMVLMIVMKRGLDTGWGRGKWMAGIRDTVSFSIAPVLALSAGSVTAWFSTLQYHTDGWRAGWARDGYLQDDYYQGRLTNVGEIVQFSYDKFREILGYHVEIIPFFALIGFSIALFALGKHIRRRSELTILFLISMVIALSAAIFQEYPIGANRHSTLWGPVIIVAFSQCIPVASELLTNLTGSLKISIRAIICSGSVLVIGFIGVLSITNEDGLFSEPLSFEVAIASVEEWREEGDIIFWTEGEPGPFIGGMPFIKIHYGGDIPKYYRVCNKKSCLDDLLDLRESRRLWIAFFNAEVNDIVLLEKLANIQGNTNILYDAKVTGDITLYLVHDSQVLIDLYHNTAETFPEILDHLGYPTLERKEYEVYRSDDSLLYVTDNCEETRPTFFVHIFPSTIDDLPLESQGAKFENQSFFFSENSVNLEGTCVALHPLPRYPFSRIVTGQFSGDDRIWYGAIDFARERRSTEISRDFLDTLGLPVLSNSGWDVYLSDQDIIYVSDDTCEFSVDTHPFFLHIHPVDREDLPAESQPHGFENRDFHSPFYADALDDGCVVVRSLPTYPVALIETGRYHLETSEKIWRGVIFLSDRNPAEISRDFLDALGNSVLTNSGWDVYLLDQDIIYVSNNACDFSVDVPTFFLHVYPIDVEELSVESQPHGFENRDFHSPVHASGLDGGCVVVRPLPTYPVARIETGQYLVETGEKIWIGVIAGELLE